MVLRTKPREGDIQVGVVGFRAPDGSIVKTLKLYREAPAGEEQRDGLTAGEKAVCERIVRDMAAQFGEYVERTKGGCTPCTHPEN